MHEGSIADDEESRNAFCHIIEIGQTDSTEKENVIYLPKKFVDLIKEYLDQSLFAEGELSAWDQFMGAFFNDSKSPEEQRQE